MTLDWIGFLLHQNLFASYLHETESVLHKEAKKRPVMYRAGFRSLFITRKPTHWLNANAIWDAFLRLWHHWKMELFSYLRMFPPLSRPSDSESTAPSDMAWLLFHCQSSKQLGTWLVCPQLFLARTCSRPSWTYLDISLAQQGSLVVGSASSMLLPCFHRFQA